MDPASTVTLTVNTLATLTQTTVSSTLIKAFMLHQTTIITTAPSMIVALPIHVQWQPTDVAIMSLLAEDSAASSIASINSLAVQTTLSSTSPAPTVTNDSRSPPGLPPNTIAGIGFVLGTTVLLLVLFSIFMCLRRKERKAAIQEEIVSERWEGPGTDNASRITHYCNIELSGDKDPVELPVSERPQELPEHMSTRSWRRSVISVFSFAHSVRSQPQSDVPPVPPVPRLAHQLPPLETGEFSKALLQRHWRLSITSTKNYAANKANSRRSRRERPSRPTSPPDTINTIKE